MAIQAGPCTKTDYSLVLCGPLHQLLLRARLSGDGLELLGRRVITIAAIAWLPLFGLSLWSGHAFGDAIAVPFLRDVEAHVRFLIGLPLLIGAELIVHRRLIPVVTQFVERRVIGTDDMPAFQRAVDSTRRLRNSIWVEAALLGFVYTVGIWIWRTEVALETASWYADPDGTAMRLTAAGYWLAFVSVPIFQFILLRWYFRFLVWFLFLFRVSRLNLVLLPTHADRTGGLGFLGGSATAFAPVLMAQGAILAGLIASQIFHAGKSLPEFKVQIVAFLAFFIVVTLVPLAVFVPRLAAAKRAGLRKFGGLASEYSGSFEGKWLGAGGARDSELLGSGDLQSLADLGNSFEVVREMRLLPFGWRDVTRLGAITATPFLPLLLTVFSLEDLANFVIKTVF